MGQNSRSFGLVTGASSGIGLELARIAAEKGFDLLIAANDEGIHRVARGLSTSVRQVAGVKADLATLDGVDMVCSALVESGRPVDALFANAGRGLGRAFLDQSFDEVRNVIDTNILGTVYLLQRIGRMMRDRHAGRILITGSIVGFMPGSYQAVYNGTKAFIDSFAAAFRNELEGSGVTVTCLMPGATDTHFFERADMMDTHVATQRKDRPADVAKTGFEAMMRGDASAVHGLMNKAQVIMSHVLPDQLLEQAYRNRAAPGTAKS